MNYEFTKFLLQLFYLLTQHAFFWDSTIPGSTQMPSGDEDSVMLLRHTGRCAIIKMAVRY